MSIVKYKVFITAAAVQGQEDGLWQLYYAEQLTARGLNPGDGLDVRIGDGVRVAITNRYCKAVVSGSFVGGAIPCDAYVQAKNGAVAPNAVTIDSAAPIDASLLPAALQALVPP